VQACEYEMVYFAGDDLFALYRPRGLPIGNLTSQHWANVYLNELDQYAKRVLKCRAYIRYVDDILLFADDRESLHDWKQRIIMFLQTLRLTLHETKAQPRPTWTGLSFLGFQVFFDHRRLKPANGYAFQRRLLGMLSGMQSGRVGREKFQSSLQSWLNHASYGNTWGLRRAILANTGIDGGPHE
jgi:hypothetical protein